MKVWVTKYALTTGIQEHDVKVIDNSMVKVEGKYPQYFFGCDWHRTRELAAIRAEEMRIKKIASLKKQIAKLENMKFEIKNDDR